MWTEKQDLELAWIASPMLFYSTILIGITLSDAEVLLPLCIFFSGEESSGAAGGESHEETEQGEQGGVGVGAQLS